MKTLFFICLSLSFCTFAHAEESLVLSYGGAEMEITCSDGELLQSINSSFEKFKEEQASRESDERALYYRFKTSVEGEKSFVISLDKQVSSTTRRYYGGTEDTDNFQYHLQYRYPRYTYNLYAINLWTQTVVFSSGWCTVN